MQNKTNIFQELVLHFQNFVIHTITLMFLESKQRVTYKDVSNFSNQFRNLVNLGIIVIMEIVLLFQIMINMRGLEELILHIGALRIL